MLDLCCDWDLYSMCNTVYFCTRNTGNTWNYCDITSFKCIYKSEKSSENVMIANKEHKVGQRLHTDFLPVISFCLCILTKLFFWCEKHSEKNSAVRPLTKWSLYLRHWRMPCFFLLFWNATYLLRGLHFSTSNVLKKPKSHSQYYIKDIIISSRCNVSFQEHKQNVC